MRTTTHITKQRELISNTQLEVMSILHLKEEDYLNLFYEAGCGYLERLEKVMVEKGVNEPDHWQRIKKSELFWKWWKVQFSLKDREVMVCSGLDTALYMQAHIANEIIIPKHVLNEIFPS
jgi:hypothetical protein